jgi:Fe-S oxidoreductase
MRQVEETGATTMVSACSNCRLTMDESKAALGWDKELASLVEILAEHLEEGPPQAPSPPR